MGEQVSRSGLMGPHPLPHLVQAQERKESKYEVSPGKTSAARKEDGRAHRGTLVI